MWSIGCFERQAMQQGFPFHLLSQRTVLRLQTMTLEHSESKAFALRSADCVVVCITGLSFAPVIANESFMIAAGNTASTFECKCAHSHSDVLTVLSSALQAHLNANAVHSHSGVLTVMSCENMKLSFAVAGGNHSLACRRQHRLHT